MEDNTKKAPSPKNPYDSYRKTAVMTASRETILLMLYAGAIRFLKQAIDAVAQNNFADKATYLGRTLAIINELQATLNFEVGGDIAKSLDGLYGFISHRILSASANHNNEGLQEALKVLETLNGAWEQAVVNVRKEKQAQAQGQAPATGSTALPPQPEK